MQHFKIFIALTRLNKPIGFMLLFWPCSWGLAYAYSVNQDYNLFIYYLILFFLGSVLMRSAGCIVNDIVDKDFDKKVKRTRKRPIASKKISVNRSLLYVLILCSLAFLVLIQFNFLTIILGMSSMVLAFAYPFMKRITYWPQLFLGVTFNWGLIMAWVSITNIVNYEIFILYLSAIFWTLGYDTIYGAQDMSDDEIIGLKSTSIKFKENLKMFVFISYFITVIIMLILLKNSIGINLLSFFLFCFIATLAYQIKKMDKNEPQNYLRLFKLNNLAGLIMFLTFVTKNI